MTETKQESIGGLWINTSSKGVPYLSGKIGDQDVVVFKNTHKKEGEKSPDYRVYARNAIKTEAVKKDDLPF